MIRREDNLMSEAAADYPASLTVEYPDRELDRVTTLLRLFAVIPIGIVVGLLMWGFASDDEWGPVFGAFVVGPTLLMILFQQKYPRWWFDWNLGLARFFGRFMAYVTLLRDEYPSTDEEQAVHIDISYPDVKEELSRVMPLFKWLLAIPHYAVLFFLTIAAVVVVIIAWFAILFTGRYPRDLFDFVVGVLRWYLRVFAYAFLLTTDRYPPFSITK
jgi:hypothetical protein